MVTILVAMTAVIVVAAGVLALVMIGIEGHGRSRAPKIAERLTKAAVRLNGEPDPSPQRAHLLS